VMMEIWLPRDKQWFLADIALGVREGNKLHKQFENLTMPISLLYIYYV
jgi:hypothetical protein